MYPPFAPNAETAPFTLWNGSEPVITSAYKTAELETGVGELFPASGSPEVYCANVTLGDKKEKMRLKKARRLSRTQSTVHLQRVSSTRCNTSSRLEQFPRFYPKVGSG